MKENMRIKRILLVLICITMLLFRTETIMACTIFTVILDDGSILACNNEDWMYSISNSMIISAAEAGNYGRVCFYNASYVQGGMNEHGLFYDGASCPSTKVPHDNTKKDLGYDLGEVVLAKCKSVKEAEEFLEAYNIPAGFYDHLLFADASGDVAVFEWVNNEFKIIRKDAAKQYQVITNFWLSDPSLGGYPCSRYNTIDETLSSSDLSFELSESLLGDTRQDWGNGGTLYSNICNLVEREVYLYYRGEKNQAYQFNLTDELAKMKPGTAKIMRMDEICRGDISDAATLASSASSAASVSSASPISSASSTSSTSISDPDAIKVNGQEAGYALAPLIACILGAILFIAIKIVFKHTGKRK